MPQTVCRVCQQLGAPDGAVRVPGATRDVEHETFTVWRCRSCGSLNALEAVDPDHIYRNYPIQRQAYDLMSRAMFAKRLRILRQAGLQQQHRVLDHGCGSGHFLRYLRAQGYNAEGYDPYNSRHNDPGVLQGGFDVVTSQDVIEHVDDPQRFILDLVAHARPTGVVVVGTPFADHVNLHDRIDQLGVLHQPFHRFVVARAQVPHLFQAPGWQLSQVIEACHIDTPMPFANTQFLFRLFNSLGGLMDPAFEPIPPLHFLRHPSLLFWGLCGSWLARRQDLFAVMTPVRP